MSNYIINQNATEIQSIVNSLRGKSYRVTNSLLHALLLKIQGTNISCITANKYLNVGERVKMVVKYKYGLLPPVL